MAIKCSGCGNFISSDLHACLICGDATDVNSSSLDESSHPPPGLIYDMWDNVWQNRSGESVMSHGEAMALKILMGVLAFMLAVTIYFVG